MLLLLVVVVLLFLLLVLLMLALWLLPLLPLLPLLLLVVLVFILDSADAAWSFDLSFFTFGATTVHPRSPDKAPQFRLLTTWVGKNTATGASTGILRGKRLDYLYQFDLRTLCWTHAAVVEFNPTFKSSAYRFFQSSDECAEEEVRFSRETSGDEDVELELSVELPEPARPRRPPRFLRRRFLPLLDDEARSGVDAATSPTAEE